MQDIPSISFITCIYHQPERREGVRDVNRLIASCRIGQGMLFQLGVIDANEADGHKASVSNSWAFTFVIDNRC